MGKKSKRHQAQGGAQKTAPGVVINSKAVIRVVDELWAKTQSPASQSIASQWQEYDNTCSLVKVLREKQGPSPIKFPVRSEGFAAFQQWVHDHGAEHSSVEIAEFEHGYGLRAKKPIKEGEKVLVIPETIMVTSETAHKGPLGRLVARDRMLQVMPNVTLALHLLNERYKPDSYWKPYIDILPHTFTTPLYFSKQELHLLQGSPCLSEALQQTRSIAKLYGHLHKLIRNEIPLKDGKETTLALIPLWDMCNHTLTQMGTDFNLDNRSCECYAAYPLSEGEEFKIFYGARSNAELFIHQGFAYPPHNGDSLRIKLGLSSGEDSSTKVMKTQLLKRLGLPVSGAFHLLAETSCPFSAQLRVFVRIFTADMPELQRYVSLEDIRLRKELVSLQWRKSDIKALHFLEKRVELLLQSYQTSYQADYEMLPRKDISDCVRQAVMLRLTEKCILGHAQMVAKHTRETLEQAAASGADIVVEMSMREEGEEEEEEGFNDKCADTEYKAGVSGGGEGSSGSDQLRFMSGDGIEDKPLVEESGEEEEEEERGRKTLCSCEKVGDAVVGIVEETNREDSSQLHKEFALEDRVRITEIAEEEGGLEERCCVEKRSCEEIPTLVPGDSKGELVTKEAESVSEELYTQTAPDSQDSLHQAT